MTMLQKCLTAAAIAAVGAAIFESRRATNFGSQVQTLQQQQAPLAGQIQGMQRERDDMSNRLGSLVDENEQLKRNAGGTPRLSGEGGRGKRPAPTRRASV